jgi:hypothetical protein
MRQLVKSLFFTNFKDYNSEILKKISVYRANGGKTTNHHVPDAEFKRNIENIKLLYKKIALRNSLTCPKSMTNFII